MKLIPTVVVAFLILSATGCTPDRTQNMAKTCQSLLAQDDTSSDKRFIREAEDQLASLNKPGNRLTDALRNIQDKDAMRYKPALEECLWRIKSRGS